MNERIKELAVEAKLPSYVLEYGTELCLAPHLEKFAELIVRECLELALAEQKRYANISHRNMSECAVALGNFSLLIKDHFEDEE